MNRIPHIALLALLSGLFQKAPVVVIFTLNKPTDSANPVQTVYYRRSSTNVRKVYTPFLCTFVCIFLSFFFFLSFLGHWLRTAVMFTY